MSRQSLTIYLVKEAYSEDEVCIRPEELSSLDTVSLDLNGATHARLYLRKNKSKRPDWSKLFLSVDWSKYRTNTFSGLLIIDVSGRRFAIASGSGRYLLNPFAPEENFGFRTVVNSVDPATIRKIEKRTINQNPMNSIEQLARTSSLNDFEVDYFTDIVSKIRAKSSISEFGTIIDGRDSLHISTECDVGKIPAALAASLKAYESDSYKKLFPNIDNIASVGDRALNQALDEALVKRWNDGVFDGSWAAMPEIIQDEDFDVFQYSMKSNALRYHDIELQKCLEKYTTKGKVFKKSDLERDKIFVRMLNGEVYPRWSVWKCIYAEVNHSGQLYVLIDGQWYRVSQNYIDRLDEQIAAIPNALHDLPNWQQHDREDVYLGTVDDKYLVLDKDLVYVEGESPIELCDLFLPQGTFIHVKRYGSSQVLSHLFNQGRVAAKLLLNDSRFRAAAHEKFPENAPFEIDERPDAKSFKIVFLIGSKHGDNQKLPLFARVVLVNAFSELRGYGFDVSLGFIKVDLI